MTLEFTVYGIAAPKGSTKAFMRPGARFPSITHDSARTKPWQESVVVAARNAFPLAPWTPLDGPVMLLVRFYLPRPKSASKRVLKPLKKPDLDKLVRCVKDGLTRAGVYRDDSQVVHITASKHFAAGEDDRLGAAGIPRAIVAVTSAEEAVRVVVEAARPL